MKTCALKTYSIVLGATACFTFSALSYAVSSSSLQSDNAIQAINAVTGSPVEFSRSENTGQINYLSTTQAHPVPLFSSPDASAEARALEFITTYGKSFGVTSAKQIRTVKVSGKDEVGMEHVRLQQLHKGIPVTAGEMTVHLRGNSVVSVLSKTVPGLDDLDVTPQITPADAEKTVQELLEKLGIDNASLSKPKLEVFNKSLLQGGKQPAYLAWFIEAKKLDVREYVWVDAHRGTILLHFSQLAEARKRKIYDTFSSDILPGTLVRSEGQGPTGDADADKAYLFSGHTYDYFKNQHGRDSYDGFGATIISTVHYCDFSFPCPYENAFWNGDQMVYGEGFSAADDVDAHELTHAVTENSARLFYYTQSGALNESFSDIFGETVDLGNGAGNDNGSVRWLLGEDVPGSGAIRNMKNPGAFNDPGQVNDANFKCDINDGDQGGVHSNSGVPNHAYALMVDGGSFNGQNVTGIGLTKAGKIEYRALTQYLTSGSTFLDDYNALQRACTDLIGTAGITSANCTQVKNALNAVKMNAPVCSKPVAPALCATPSAKVKTLFFDGLEASGGNFVSSDFTVWSIVQGYASAGSLSMFGAGTPDNSDTNYKMTKNVLIPAAGARMQFDHAFEFESDAFSRYDGGVVEYSTDNGISWFDAGNLQSAGQKYNGKITNTSGNPLGGRNAFTATSFGYTATQLNLGALKGKNVRFRFRIGTDDAAALTGWFIDNIRIYQCQ